RARACAQKSPAWKARGRSQISPHRCSNGQETEQIVVKSRYCTSTSTLLRVGLFRLSQDLHHNSRRPPFAVIDALGRFHEIGGLGIGDVDESLRVAVGEREPRTLHLYHDAMASPESVIHVLHGEVDLFPFAGSQSLRL